MATTSMKQGTQGTQGLMEHPIATRASITDWGKSLGTPLVLTLTVLLGTQLLAAVLLGGGGSHALAPAAADATLLHFDPKAVTSLRIEGGGQTLTLARGDQGWLLADLGDFPADGGKVDQLLGKLAGLKRPLPVATSPEALKRHKVADDGFERKVTLEVGDATVATLLLGDSPAFKRQFARPAGETAVYDLDLPLFEVSNRRDDWLMHDRLKLDQEQIASITAADWTLTKGKDGWQLADSQPPPDAATVTNLVSRISNLGYRGVLGTQDQPEYQQTAPVLELRLGLKDGGTRAYRISKVKDGQDYVLKAADRPWYFKLSEFDLEGLIDVNRAKLLGVAPEPAPTADG
ncbi:MAG TPA: DUF4340 domain-containing protein, partial [Lamprocystis sp. (in: g-proteobacteria)]|nr:DUF4340 domain-containing protein [Lamprocystis sp. (in: g-proteobacteria)]